MMIPPPAFSRGTAISTVGVVDKPRSTTLIPIDCNVPVTRWLTISPLIRASRPITITGFPVVLLIQVPNAAVNLIMSSGVRLCPALPPIVPRMPEMLLISVIPWRKGTHFHAFTGEERTDFANIPGLQVRNGRPLLTLTANQKVSPSMQTAQG